MLWFIKSNFSHPICFIYSPNSLLYVISKTKTPSAIKTLLRPSNYETIMYLPTTTLSSLSLILVLPSIIHATYILTYKNPQHYPDPKVFTPNCRIVCGGRPVYPDKPDGPWKWPIQEWKISSARLNWPPLDGTCSDPKCQGENWRCRKQGETWSDNYLGLGARGKLCHLGRFDGKTEGLGHDGFIGCFDSGGANNLVINVLWETIFTSIFWDARVQTSALQNICKYDAIWKQQILCLSDVLQRRSWVSVRGYQRRHNWCFKVL